MLPILASEKKEIDKTPSPKLLEPTMVEESNEGYNKFLYEMTAQVVKDEANKRIMGRKKLFALFD